MKINNFLSVLIFFIITIYDSKIVDASTNWTIWLGAESSDETWFLNKFVPGNL